MKLRTYIAALLCAAILTGCGATSSNESSLQIELVTNVTTAAAGSSTAAASNSSETTVSGTDQTNLTSSESLASTASSVSDVSSETTQTETTEQIQTTESETAAQQTKTEAPVEMTEVSVQTTALPATTPPPATTAAPQTTEKTAKKSLFQELKPTNDCTAYITSHTGFTKQEDVSCHGEGTDRVYTYPDYTIYTFFHDGIDEVWELAVTAPGIALDTGIEVGMTKADVTAKYGASDDDSYKVNHCILSFFYDDADRITEISLMQPEE